MPGPFSDVEAISVASTDWKPTKAGWTSAILCTSSGNLYVNLRGIEEGVAGTVGALIPATAGVTYELLAVKVLKTSTTGSYMALY